MSARDATEAAAGTLRSGAASIPVAPGAAGTTTVVPGSVPIVGELLALIDGGRTPLVLYPGQPGLAALRARTVTDLHGAHVGKPVLLVFEAADPRQPIVVGVLRGADDCSLEQRLGNVDVDADGERLIVSAKTQLVLRCGKASVTLTRAGKVLIEGTYVSSRSMGVHRIKGGSVEIN